MTIASRSSPSLSDVRSVESFSGSIGKISRRGVDRRRVVRARARRSREPFAHERVDVGDRDEDPRRAVAGRGSATVELVEVARVVVVDRAPRAGRAGRGSPAPPTRPAPGWPRAPRARRARSPAPGRSRPSRAGRSASNPPGRGVPFRSSRSRRGVYARGVATPVELRSARGESRFAPRPLAAVLRAPLDRRGRGHDRPQTRGLEADRLGRPAFRRRRVRRQPRRRVRRPLGAGGRRPSTRHQTRVRIHEGGVFLERRRGIPDHRGRHRHRRRGLGSMAIPSPDRGRLARGRRLGRGLSDQRLRGPACCSARGGACGRSRSAPTGVT